MKKKNDINKDKWIGIGGKFEGEESPDECLLREAKEETGLTLTSWRCRGVVTFLSDTCEGEFMYLFTADGFEGELTSCSEGDLKWVSREFLDSLPKWEGDQIFLDLLWKNAPFFLLKLWCRLQTWLGSGVAVAVVWAGSCSSDSPTSLGTSICCRSSPKN